MALYDFDELIFGDEWPGPQPTWPMVLTNLETVLLNGLSMSYEYLSSYVTDSFEAPTSEALHYFIHEMDMGNPDESGFLGCINCITNLIALLDHVGMMMDMNQDTPNVLSSYVGQLNTLSEDLTQLATELETYIDLDNPEDPVDISYDAFDSYVGRFQSYIGILQNVHDSLALYDFDELTFGDEWPGPRPTWPMVLMNLETVLLNGLETSHEYLASYLADSFVAPTSEALHYFIHEMDMGNPDESGFLGCINCITNMIALLDHVGMMIAIN